MDRAATELFGWHYYLYYIYIYKKAAVTWVLVRREQVFTWSLRIHGTSDYTTPVVESFFFFDSLYFGRAKKKIQIAIHYTRNNLLGFGVI